MRLPWHRHLLSAQPIEHRIFDLSDRTADSVAAVRLTNTTCAISHGETIAHSFAFAISRVDTAFTMQRFATFEASSFSSPADRVW